MIEVEVRGWLSEQQAKELEACLKAHGRHLRSQDRELILLKDGYLGYDQDTAKHHTEIRFRKTNGSVEIVAKVRASEGNLARHEYIYPVAVDSIDTLIPLARAFGAHKALWMRRDAEIYEADGIEWSIVRATSRDKQTVRLLFEAEVVVERPEEISAAQTRLEYAVAQRGLTPLYGAKHQAFIEELGRTVNQPLDLTATES